MWTIQIIDKFANKPINVYVNKNHELKRVMTNPCLDDMVKFDKIGNCMKLCVELMEHQFEPQFDNFPEFKAKVFRLT